MSNSVSTLLTRNLLEVFGENDPARRRAAINEIYTGRRRDLPRWQALRAAGPKRSHSPGSNQDRQR